MASPQSQTSIATPNSTLEAPLPIRGRPSDPDPHSREQSVVNKRSMDSLYSDKATSKCRGGSKPSKSKPVIVPKKESPKAEPPSDREIRYTTLSEDKQTDWVSVVGSSSALIVADLLPHLSSNVNATPVRAATLPAGDEAPWTMPTS